MALAALKISNDYRVPLLQLMADLGSATITQAQAAFDARFGRLIPAAHREKDEGGWIKWQHYVAWSRYDLVKAGLMGSGGRGIWTITPLGREWLHENPNAASRDLAALIGGTQTAAESGFQWRGQRYTVDKKRLLAQARRLLKDNPPAEALRYKDWAALVDGQPVSVKWLFSLATGADYNQFDSPTARRALAQIGIQAQQMGQTEGASPPPPPPVKRADKVQERDEFLGMVADLLVARMPAQAQQGQIRPAPGRNWLQIVYADLHRSHYELRLARGFDEVAFHLEGRREDNLARLAVMAAHKDELTAAMGRRVLAEPWGSNWARLAIDLPTAPWTDSQADEYAALLAQFIGVTLPFVRQAFSGTQHRVSNKRPRKPTTVPVPDAAAHAILDAQLAEVRAFLQGRASRPSDRALCDWVRFCYTFELFAEGRDLFNVIVPSAVQESIYDHTSRLASICRMRATPGGNQE